ncbi:40S ribosomal protein S5-1 [Hordeum vulgare]|nr:40S ribosomal protein S5-1 [Hordeum vulgare]
MREGMLHICDVEGLKKTGSVETRLEAMEQQVFKYQGMVERGLNANHMMITEFTNKHKIDANDIGSISRGSMTGLINSRPRSMTCRTKTEFKNDFELIRFATAS